MQIKSSLSKETVSLSLTERYSLVTRLGQGKHEVGNHRFEDTIGEK